MRDVCQNDQRRLLYQMHLVARLWHRRLLRSRGGCRGAESQSYVVCSVLGCEVEMWWAGVLGAVLWCSGWCSVLLPGRLARPGCGRPQLGHQEGRRVDTRVWATWGVRLPGRLLDSG